MANKNFVAYGDAETLFTEVGSELGKRLLQCSIIPAASATLLDSIVQYIGTTDANYTNGYFYKCVSDGSGNYSWESINLQNPGITVNATLLASGWNASNEQTLTFTGYEASMDGVVGIPSNATDAQKTAYTKAIISISAQSGNQLTFKAKTVPTVDLPVTLYAGGSGNGSGSSITVDSAMSSTSENPVQNKVITTALGNKADSTHTHDAASTASNGFMTSAQVTKLNGIAEGATANIGTVTQINVGTSSYTPISGVVSLPTYPDTSTFMTKGVDYVTAGRKSGSTAGNKSTAEGNETVANNDFAHAEGESTTASGINSHAEGYKTYAQGNYSHAEGYETVANGSGAHAEGNQTTALSGAHAEGNQTTALSGAHAEGDYTYASGSGSHVEGYFATAENDSHAEGYSSCAYGNYSHAEGSSRTSGEYAHAEGCGYASGYYSHAEGGSQEAAGDYSHAEGYYTCASGKGAHAEGGYSTNFNSVGTFAIGENSHAEGYYTTASGYASHAEGDFTIASLGSAHAEGEYTTASNSSAHSEGSYTKASGGWSHAEGCETTASNEYAHVEGRGSLASGESSHAEGYHTTALNFASHASGKFNAVMTDGGSASSTTGTAFVIGNGTSASALSNAFSVQYNGTVKAASTITASTTADYAEYFEWADENIQEEDRVGYFVTFDDGKKIRIASSADDYILGVVSGEPFVLGNGDCDVWNGMVLRDKFNRKRYEPAQKYELDPETGEEIPVTDDFNNPVYEGTKPVYNPDYDPTLPYINRADRPEWAAVGMLGVLAVRDDGTCEVNGYCTINQNGIATKGYQDDSIKYRVIKRNAEDVVEILFR